MEEELVMALEGLGYTKKDIDRVIDKEKIKTYKNIQEAIKDTLKNIQKK
ncbi:RuvA C-terminal domain-containing protein [Fusobacterium sp.]|nr:RuvA C-terminal domain-containing protein [Fusobacterium sp.]